MTTTISYGDLRSNAEKIEDEEIKERVLAGIDVLNDFDPNWADYIDPNELILSNATMCVLGQRFKDDLPTEEQAIAFLESRISRDIHYTLGDLTGGRAQSYFRGLAILDGEVMVNPSAFGFDIPEGDLREDLYTLLTRAWQTAFGCTNYNDDEGV